MSKLSQTRLGSSTQGPQARRRSLASRLWLLATFTIALAAIAVAVPWGYGQRSISYVEASFESGNTVDVLFPPSAGNPPHFAGASSRPHNRPLRLQQLVGNVRVRAFIGVLRDGVPILVRAPWTSTTGLPPAAPRARAGAPTTSSVPIVRVLPSPTPTATPQDQRAWPPGTTADTYAFTNLNKTVADVQSLINGKTYAERAFDVLNQLSTQDTVDALKLLQRVRDESHRLANTYNAALRLKRISESILDEFPNIGERRKAALLKKFGSVQRIRMASVEKIAQVPGFGGKAAAELKAFLDARSTTPQDEPDPF